MAVPVVMFIGFAGLAGMALLREEPNALPTALAQRPAPSVGTEALPGKTLLTDEMLRQPGVKLVNFWASWCGPCRLEHPTLTELSKTIPVYGVNYKDRAEQAIAFLDQDGDPFQAQTFDPNGRTGLDWGVTAPPETFIIDGQGRIIYRFAGPLYAGNWDNIFKPRLDRALAAQDQAAD